MNAPTILIVEDDVALRSWLARDARMRGYDVLVAATLAEVVGLAGAQPFEIAVIDLALGDDSGLDALRAIRLQAPDTEIVVVSGTTSLASAIESYELDAFAFILKPFDVDQLFATIDRAADHRAVVLANRRLMWEQRLINEIGDELRQLLAPGDLVDRVLRRLMVAMKVEFSAARVLNQAGEFDVRMHGASDELQRFWSRPFPELPRPSDRVLATREAYRIDDLHQLFPGTEIARHLLRSALSVPMFAGNDLIGVLTVGSFELSRFGAEDERMLGVIANHVAVGVMNARLHAFVRAGKQEWEATFDAIGDPIAVFDRHGRIVRGNQALARYAGRPVTALRGLSCDQLGLCGGTFPACAVGQARERPTINAEVARPVDRIFSVTTCPVDDPTHGAAIVQIAKDVTQEIHSARRLQTMSDELAAANARLVATVDRLKATQAQLLQAEKLSAIGQLVAGVAHELNNPLTSVIGYAQLLQSEVGDLASGNADLPPTLSHDLRRITEESERAAKIVRNLLAFARRQSAERAEQDVADVVTRVLALRAYEFRLNAIELQTSFEPGLPPVLGDAGQLQQALLNLLLNAEQAMRSRPVRRIHVGARLLQESEAVELFLADTGHGIQGENLRRIFDPFFTTREVGEGTGLGLSICYGIVRDHGGQIAVESRVGQGTTFKVQLPARSGDQPIHALVLHRDQTERDYIAAALAGWGHRVSVAEGVEDARARCAADAIDVAFVDHALIGTDLEAWRRSLSPGGRPAAAILLTEAAGTEGVAPPFELAALRAALRGITKECV